MSSVLWEDMQNVRILTINRPERENRISEEVANDLLRLLEDADNSNIIRAVILTGASDNFCLGGDPLDSGGSVGDLLGFSEAFGDLTRKMWTLGTPILAAVNGKAHAGGFSVLCCADLVIAAQDSTFALPELAGGYFPILAMATAQRLLPRAVFFDLVYCGRELTADEAISFGIVNEVVTKSELKARTLEIAQSLAKFNREAIRVGRKAYAAMSELPPAAAVDHARTVLPVLVGAVEGTVLKEKLS